MYQKLKAGTQGKSLLSHTTVPYLTEMQSMAALFTIAKGWWTDEWMSEMWCIHQNGILFSTKKRGTSTKELKKKETKKKKKRKEILAHTPTQMNLEDIDGGGLVTRSQPLRPHGL